MLPLFMVVSTTISYDPDFAVSLFYPPRNELPDLVMFERDAVHLALVYRKNLFSSIRLNQRVIEVMNEKIIKHANSDDSLQQRLLKDYKRMKREAESELLRDQQILRELPPFMDIFPKRPPDSGPRQA